MVIILTLTQTNKVNIIWSNSIAKEGLKLSLLVLIPLDFNQSSKRRSNENESLKWVHQRVIFCLKLSRSSMFSITALVLFIFEFEFRFFKHQATFEFACADWVCHVVVQSYGLKYILLIFEVLLDIVFAFLFKSNPISYRQEDTPFRLNMDLKLQAFVCHKTMNNCFYFTLDLLFEI